MCVAEYDDIVQAFAAYRPNQPFTMSIGGRHPNRRSQHVDAPTLHFCIEAGRESLMPIVKEKLAIGVAGKRFPELLQGPVSCRMRGHVEVNQTPGPDLESDEYIEDTEAYRDCDKEIAGDNLMRMIAEKSCPALILRSMRSRRAAACTCQRFVGRSESAVSARVHPRSALHPRSGFRSPCDGSIASTRQELLVFQQVSTSTAKIGEKLRDASR